MFCKKCGKENSELARFCKECGENIFLGKKCPFCKSEISLLSDVCPSCKQVLIEKIGNKYKERKENSYSNNTPPHDNFILIFLKKLRSINYHKLIFSKFGAIVVGVIFFIWIYSIDDTSNNGSKIPLPAPVKQDTSLVDRLNSPTSNVSLANGTIIKKNTLYLRGDGELEIKNGTSLDAVAKLIRNGTSVLTIYIKANNNYTIKNISDGTYWLAFAQGTDWNSTTQKFNRNPQYSVFDETFNYITTDTQYWTFEVTLNPVVGGTAETSDVDPSQFNAY
jgi:hypothetical protein